MFVVIKPPARLIFTLSITLAAASALDQPKIFSANDYGPNGDPK